MRGKSELFWSVLAMGVITLIYLVYMLFAGIPEAGSLFGHVLGVTGFLLMLATETLYSIRKRAIHRPWGRMQTWLKFHIFTGIVGPYMVLLHAAWSFKGLAGIVILLTGVVVISGFIGRYIYTSVPRTADGLIVAAETIQTKITALEAELQLRLNLRHENIPAPSFLAATSGPSVMGKRLGGIWQDIFQMRKTPKLSAKDRAIASEIEIMERRKREMQRQIKSLAIARRALSLWHKIHIPLGMAMFTAALFHIVAAVYFGTLLR